MTKLPHKLYLIKNFFISVSPLFLLVVLVAFKPLFVHHVFKEVQSGKAAVAGPHGFGDRKVKVMANSGESVLSPISVVDEAFEGFNIPKAIRTGSDATGTNDGYSERITEPTPLPKLAPEAVEVRKTDANVPRTPVSVRRPDNAQDDELKQIDALASRAGLPEAKKKEILRSYEDLSRIMPKKEALKIIMMRLETSKASAEGTPITRVRDKRYTPGSPSATS